MTRRFALVAWLAVILAVAGTSSELAAQVLSVDFGRNTPTPVQPGFTGISGGAVEASHTEVVGAYTVKVEGEGFFSSGATIDPAVAGLLVDYYYHNSPSPTVGITGTITGVTPNQDYDLKLWSYDGDNIFSVTPVQWGPVSGSATTGTTGLVSDSGTTLSQPTTLNDKATTIRLRSTTNELTFFGSSTGGGGGTRLNGLQLSVVPEPTAAALFGAAAAALVAVRRRLVSHR